MSELNKDAALALKHFSDLLESSSTPEVPSGLEENEEFMRMHNNAVELRKILASFMRGDLSETIHQRGFMAGSLKALQSHLRHLTWQVQQVERGDFSQRVEFLGEFSGAFNNMVVQLDTTMTALRQKEEALTNLAKTLQKEVELRSSAVYALKQSEAKFRYLAEHDSLTGALNRRSFHTLAVNGMQSAHLAGVPCCIALLDVDHFKVFNDTYGHLDGDHALKQVVSIASKCLRQTDALGRYGGEEFILFFSSTNLETGTAAANRIRQAIANTPVHRPDGPPVPITVSIGVTVCLPEWFSSPKANILFQQIIGQADAALYEAKRTGRNKVCPAPTLMPSLNIE